MIRIHRHRIIVAVVLCAIVSAAFFTYAVPYVLGGGGGGGGGGAQGYGSGTNCGNCNSTWNSSMGSMGAGQWEDTNGDGRLSTGDRITGSSGGGGNNTSGGTRTPQPTGPRACSLRIAPTTTYEGTRTIELRWDSNRYGNGYNTNNRLTVRRPNGTTAELWGGNDNYYEYTHTGAFVPGTYRYSLSFRRVGYQTGNSSNGFVNSMEPTSFTCNVNLVVRETPTECNDGRDNADTEDTLADRNDPGCHTDSDPTDGDNTYNSDDNSEGNPRPNLISTLRVGSTPTNSLTEFDAGSVIRINGTSQNTAGIYAPTHGYALGYRALNAVTPACTNGMTATGGWFGAARQPCFRDGATYIRLAYGSQRFSPSQTRALADTQVINRMGSYEVCMVSDSNDVVIETNETDNKSCTTITVNEPIAVDVNIRLRDAVTAWQNALTITPGTEVELEWRPSASAVSCRSLNPTYFALPATAAANRVRGEVTNVEEPAGGLRTYSVECVNAAGTVAVGSARVTIDTSGNNNNGNNSNGNNNNGGNPPASTATGPVILSVTPRVRNGNTVTISWDTAGRTQCVVAGTNGESIDLNGASSANSQESQPITAQTTYTISCADDDAFAQAVVNLIPQIEEF